MSSGLVRLLTMLSPAFPVGSFAYSAGLERAVSDRLVTDRLTLENWLADILRHGSLWNDAVLLAASWRCGRSGAEPREVNELALALAGSAGRSRETKAQGSAFVEAAAVWTKTFRAPAADVAYPVAVGWVAAANAVELNAVLPAFLAAAVSNLVQVAIRLSVTGQGGGLDVIAALEPEILAVAQRAEQSTLDDLGTAALVAEIAAMNHETLPSRIFRT